MRLDGKVCVVTGSSRGLGEAFARGFAAEGAAVVVTYSEQAEAAQGVAADIGSDLVVRLDQRDRASVKKAFAEVGERYGRIDVLLNNAGINRTADFDKQTDEEWNEVIDVNLTGVFLCGREAAQRMVESNSNGCIINISSISRAGNMGQTNYSAAKAGVQAMAVAWAKELSRYGIRVAAIAPGFINTEMVAGMKEAAREKLTSGIPLRRMGEPDEIAQTVEFILQNDYISGRCFDIDGGLRL